MAKATLTLSSKNYSSWSLRGWLLTKFSGLEFDEIITAPDDASAKAEILLLSSSILVPCLRHEGAVVWDTLAIAEYLNEIMPEAGLLPVGPHHARALPRRSRAKSIPASRRCGRRCRSTSRGIFRTSRSGRARRPISTAICTIWRECLSKSGGPFLFGTRSMADAMYAPVVTRFMTYDVKLDPQLVGLCQHGHERCRKCRNGLRRRSRSRPISKSSRLSTD